MRNNYVTLSDLWAITAGPYGMGYGDVERICLGVWRTEAEAQEWAEANGIELADDQDGGPPYSLLEPLDITEVTSGQDRDCDYRHTVLKFVRQLIAEQRWHLDVIGRDIDEYIAEYVDMEDE